MYNFLVYAQLQVASYFLSLYREKSFFYNLKQINLSLGNLLAVLE